MKYIKNVLLFTIVSALILISIIPVSLIILILNNLTSGNSKIKFKHYVHPRASELN